MPVEKFRGMGPEVFAQNGDIYFDIPLANDSLAKVVDAKAFRQIKKPYNAIDSEPILAYVAWLEKKSDKKLTVSKLSNSRYQIKGELTDQEAVLFQQTYDSGWTFRQTQGHKGQGYASGWKIVKDPLDFMVFVPKKPGRVEIELIYRKPLSVYLGYLITLATIGLLIRKSSSLYQERKKAR